MELGILPREEIQRAIVARDLNAEIERDIREHLQQRSQFRETFNPIPSRSLLPPSRVLAEPMQPTAEKRESSASPSEANEDAAPPPPPPPSSAPATRRSLLSWFRGQTTLFKKKVVQGPEEIAKKSETTRSRWRFRRSDFIQMGDGGTLKFFCFDEAKIRLLAGVKQDDDFAMQIYSESAYFYVVGHYSRREIARSTIAQLAMINFLSAKAWDYLFFFSLCLWLMTLAFASAWGWTGLNGVVAFQIVTSLGFLGLPVLTAPLLQWRADERVWKEISAVRSERWVSVA